jgi:hypothetical protein
MRPILLLSLVGALSAPASAGDISVDFGFRSGKGIAIAFGFSNRHRHEAPPVVVQKWVPGHYATVSKRVWVAGVCEQVWQPAVYGWSYDRCGRRVQVLVRPAGYVTVERPGHYETVQQTVWVAGHYQRC